MRGVCDRAIWDRQRVMRESAESVPRAVATGSQLTEHVRGGSMPTHIKNSLSLSVAAILLVTTCGSRARAQSLRQQADKIGMLVGAAVNPPLVEGAGRSGEVGRQVKHRSTGTPCEMGWH